MASGSIRSQHLVPGLVAPPGDRDDLRRDQPEEAADDEAPGGLLGDRHHPVAGDPPEEVERAAAGEERLVEAGVVEHGGQPDVAPGVGRDLADPAHVDAVEEARDDLDGDEQQEDEVGAQPAEEGGPGAGHGGAKDILDTIPPSHGQPPSGPRPDPPRRLRDRHHLQRGAAHRGVPGVARLVRRGAGRRLLLDRPHARDRARLPQRPLRAAHLLRLGLAEELGDGPGGARLDPDLRRRRALHAGAQARDRGAPRRRPQPRRLHHPPARLLPGQGHPLLRLAARPGGAAGAPRHGALPQPQGPRRHDHPAARRRGCAIRWSTT